MTDGVTGREKRKTREKIYFRNELKVELAGDRARVLQMVAISGHGTSFAVTTGNFQLRG